MTPLAAHPQARSGRSWLCRVVGLTCALLLAGGPVTSAQAQGADRAKAAAAMAGNAMKAYEKGDYERAAELFLNAWRTHPANSGLLYNAARATHLAGRADQAEALYKQFLEQAQKDPKLEEKAKGYLDELRLKRADAKAAEAEQAVKAGDHAGAARLYLDAARIAPERHVYRMRAAKARFQAGDLDEAEQGLKAWLAQAPADAPERGEAQTYLDRIAEARKPKPAQAPTQPKTPAGPSAPGTQQGPGGAQPGPGVTQPGPGVTQPGTQESQLLAWSTIGGGVAAGGAALGLWLVAAGAQDELNAKLENRNGKGLVTDIGYAEAQTESDRIAGLRSGAAIAGGVGVVALGVGTWLLLRGKPAERVQILPTPQGAHLAVRF